MAENSKIEWTDASWNPIVAVDRKTGKVGWHCEKVSEGCRNCYAAAINHRNLPGRGTGLPYTRSSRDKVRIEIHEKTLLAPLKWRKPRMVFVCSMSDLFAEFVSDEQIQAVFGLMSSCGQHTFQVLTKRPERMAEWFESNTLSECQAEFVVRTEGREWRTQCRGLDRLRDTSAINGSGGNSWPLPNVWLGCSVEGQEQADKRIPHLLRCPAAVRFLSCEPLLGPIDLFANDEHHELEEGFPEGGFLHTSDCPGFCDYACGGQEYEGKSIDWVIVGGESGHNARPMHPDWARSIRDKCQTAEVPFFFKKCGEWLHVQLDE